MRHVVESSLRIGLGYDAHAFAAGRPLVLGGVTIPHSRGLSGHSDADVICHAIADAILGALTAGDIGRLFPDTDPKYKGISSLLLLSRVTDLLNTKGGQILNLDTMIILEEPRISPYFEEMKENIGKALRINAGTVSIKATRNEGMGFVGRGEGVVAIAVALVRLPASK
jgi:2-C-methyl-D-erythritol 2,4-cyclodiphosphate synthase